MQLREYQIDLSTKACLLLQSYSLAYLAMQVRTGKTATALNTAQLYGAKKVLFITTKKAMSSIQKDFTDLKPSFDLYVVNYESIHTVTNEGWDLVIIDESHKLGAFPKPSERTKLLKKLCEGLPIIFLSGSPSAESFSQLYHQFWISSYSPFKEWNNFYHWAKAGFVFINQKRFSQGVINDYSKANKSKIDEYTEHLFISYTQQQAGFTQMVQEQILNVKMKESTYQLASKLRARRVHIGKNGEEVIADTEVKLMQKLHQIYSGSVITDNGDKQSICFDDSKARFIADHFAGKKIAIFYKFKAELEMLRWAFKGQLTESPEEFAHRHDMVFVSQIQSGREGINLSTADCLIMFNIDFSHVSYLQARARLQTKDRQKACELYWIFATDGIEEKIYERVKAKQDYQTKYFVKDFKIQPHPISTMKEQLNEFMGKYGISEIQMGKTIIKNDYTNNQDKKSA